MIAATFTEILGAVTGFALVLTCFVGLLVLSAVSIEHSRWGRLAFAIVAEIVLVTTFIWIGTTWG